MRCGAPEARPEAWKTITGEAPLDPWPHLIAGRAYSQLGETALADKELAAALVRSDSDPKVLFARARIFRELGKYEESIADASGAIELDSRNPDSWIVRPAEGRG